MFINSDAIKSAYQTSSIMTISELGIISMGRGAMAIVSELHLTRPVATNC